MKGDFVILFVTFVLVIFLAAAELSHNMANDILNYMTIDVEDYYHVSAFEHVIGPGKWDSYNSRILENTAVILDLLDRQNVHATFFVLGWIAEKFPRLLKEIYNRGHEIGCHSYFHRLIYKLSPEEFKEDTRKAKDVLEQITGSPVMGYRAPSYSVTKNTLWALDILEELGFRYDSSIFPIIHDRYGIAGFPRFMYKFPDRSIIEYPLTTFLLFGVNLPVSGGGYFRLFPYFFTRMFLKKINRNEKQPFVFYLHPWEIDPDQPVIKGSGVMSRFRHYNNLKKTTGRFERLLKDFKFRPIIDNREERVKSQESGVRS
jgi:polysaccharide deacetylase family protein (PEP-CTERM system associated)